MPHKHWMAKLEGNQNDLEYFEKLFPSDPAIVVKQDNTYYLKGTLFDSCNDWERCLEFARDRLEMMIGVARLQSSDEAMDVRVGSVVQVGHDGIRQEFVDTSLTIHVAVSCRIFGSERPTTAEQLINNAIGTDSLEMALRLWSEDSRTWPRLYRIVEEICSVFARPSKRPSKQHLSNILFNHQLVDNKDDVYRFLNSACNPQSGGKDARHSEFFSKPPEQSKRLANHTMSHREAVGFVASVLSRALASPAEEIRRRDGPGTQSCTIS